VLGDALLRQAQIVVCRLEIRVQPRMIGGDGHVFAELPQEVPIADAEFVGAASRDQQRTEQLAGVFDQQGRNRYGV
jgi:hypothetical protein